MSEAPPIQTAEIEKDLTRWSRRKWVAAALVVLLLQSGFLLMVPRSIVPASREPGKHTSIRFARGSAVPGELVKVQDPTLFAGANHLGFSGAAWMIKTAWKAPVEPGLPPVEFLSYREAAASMPGDSLTTPEAETPFSPTPPDTRPTSVNALLRPARESRLRVEGFDHRQLVRAPAIPPQYATDALRPSVVQVLVEPDGSVFSARLLNSSGSKIADGEALRLSKQSVFEGARSEDQEIETGKLIFDWQAVDPSQSAPQTK
jgi:hypothetical protein